MKNLLFLIAIGAFLFGAGMLLVAQTAIHEIAAFSMFLIMAVCLSGAGIIEALHVIRKDLQELKKAPKQE
ncbi:hypothetical protein [Geoalkalibacter halelectricus]|uniref:hypothetical protein n=1 Tax=Geoalkalibacter halelectricus TaxID=2847045 RepID=UPI003D198FFE